MTRFYRFVSCTALMVALVWPLAPARADDPIGVWLTEEGDAHIQFGRCGRDLCGKVVWLKEPLDPQTKKAVTDKNNQDAGKRKRPILGLTIAYAFKLAAGDKWVGTFYDSDDGQFYRGSIKRLSPDTLSVEGCVGNLCQTQTWTKPKS